MRKRVQWPILVGLLLPLAGAAALLLWLGSAAARANILLITVDSLRADHLGAYGYPRSTSPNLDALARSGVRFTGAFTQATLSGPAHATLLTSLPVPAHGVVNNSVILGLENLTLAEVLRAAGYETAMFVSDVFVSHQFGFAQGFDQFQLHPVGHHGPRHRHLEMPEPVSSPAAVFDHARAWLARPHAKPFFLWLHAQHPHESYDPPAPYDQKFAAPPASAHDLRCMHTTAAHQRRRIRLNDAERGYLEALYDGEIAYVDSQVGQILSGLRAAGLEDHTIVVLTADHGEMLFDDPDRRLVGHGRHRFDPVLRVPLLVRAPGVGGGERIETMVGLIDLAPTLLELAGIQVPAFFVGRSLVPLIRGNQDEIRSENYSCTIHTDSKARLSLRTARRKLICDKGPSQLPCQLYDLDRDPREQQDLTRDRRYARDFVRLRAALQAWFAEQMERGRVRPGRLDLKAKELLRRAGYLEPEEEQGS